MLLEEAAAEQAAIRHQMNTFQDVRCGLLRVLHKHRQTSDSSGSGYSKITIMLDINMRALENDDFPSAYSSSMLRLENAFQVTTTRPNESSRPIPRVRRISQMCDPSLVLTWLSTCRNKHGDSCIIHPRRPMPTLRLLDVHVGTVAMFSHSDETNIPQYVALSWMWDSAKEQDGLTSDRLFDSHEKGFLESLHLPPAVLDAINLVQQLDIRYLWVDLLCIIQDSATDRDIYIPHMDLIYAKVRFSQSKYSRCNTDKEAEFWYLLVRLLVYVCLEMKVQ